MPICVATLYSLAALASIRGLVDVVRQRLLAIDVLAGPHGRHGDHRMRVVGRGDHHAVDVLLLVEHLAVVGVELGLGVAS